MHYTPKHGSWLNPAEIEASLWSRESQAVGELEARCPGLADAALEHRVRKVAQQQIAEPAGGGATPERHRLGRHLALALERLDAELTGELAELRRLAAALESERAKPGEAP